MTGPRIYRETFDAGSGGWFGWIDNAAGPRPLEVRDSCLVCRSPWWIDYNHAPPGIGYLHLLAILMTRGPWSEHQREVAGENRFVTAGVGTDFTAARITLKLRGELRARGAQLCLLVQAVQDGQCAGWLLTGRPFAVTADWSEQTVVADPDPALWRPLGSRHDRRDYYGTRDLSSVLRDVNTNILLVLHPLQVVPMGPLDGDPHRLRPERDYPVWRSDLPEGYLLLDEVRMEFPAR